MSNPKYREHPLMMLFGAKRVWRKDGMNALQEGPLRLISDNCVTVEDVAICDALDVLSRVPGAWARQFQKPRP